MIETIGVIKNSIDLHMSLGRPQSTLLAQKPRKHYCKDKTYADTARGTTGDMEPLSKFMKNFHS